MNDFVNPAVQAMNLIREIGDKVSQSGEPIDSYYSNDNFSTQLIHELIDICIVKAENHIRIFETTIFRGINITLEGWKQYEQEKHGKFKGNYGFIAM